MVFLFGAAACSGASPMTMGEGAEQPDDDGSEPASSAPDGGPLGAGVTITVAASGPGRITSNPAGIDCGGDSGTSCTARFESGSVVLSTDDATTVRWSGDCSGNGDCALALGADRSVTAQTFAPMRVSFDGEDHGGDSWNAIAAGPGDSIVVTGAVQRFSVGHNAYTRAYDASGTVLWSNELRLGGEGHDQGNGIVALPDGGVLGAGVWYSGSSSRWNNVVFDIAGTGQLMSTDQGELIGDDQFNAIARDASGRVITAGSRPRGTTTPVDAWLRVRAAGDRPGWELTRRATSGSSTASGVAVDAAGNVIAVGSEDNAGTGWDGWLVKYSPEGTPLWSLSLVSSGAGSDALSEVAVGPDDSIAVVGSLDGSRLIRVYTATGTLRWEVTAAAGVGWYGVAVDSAGNVVVTGTAGTTDLVVAKYTPDGSLVWQRTVAGASGHAVTTDAQGNVVVCGTLAVIGNSSSATIGPTTDGLILRFAQ